MSDAPSLDRDRIRQLFDLRNSYSDFAGGTYTDDPYPVWHERREEAAVHPGTVHALSNYPEDVFFHGLPEADRPHFSAFTFAACDAAYRDDEVFASSPGAADGPSEAMGDLTSEGMEVLESSMLMMGGARHRRYRSLVQPSFVPAKAQWWISNWIDSTVHSLIDAIEEDGRAELNVDFCAAIPVLTITGSFGISVDQALDVREALRDPGEVIKIIEPIVAARRESPQDDLLSVLVESEITDDDGVTHRLTDAEIYSFSYLLLAAGSGTTWKQMGITLAALFQRPKVLEAVRRDRKLLDNAIEESVRWMPTDPMFSRWVARDIDFHGMELPKGAVLHLCLGAANRDPERWPRPDEFDISRKPKPSLGFGGGAHVCLGMHVARAEMRVGIGALLDRLPGLRLDPEANPPEPVGFYERGVMEIPVVFDG